MMPLAALPKAEEAAQRAAATVAAAMRPGEHPKLFDDDLLQDMQECLLKLEKRVNQGRGSLSVLEAEEFDFATQRILEEMKRNEHNRPKPVPAIPDGIVVPPGTAAESAGRVSNKQTILDTSMDEGPAYDGQMEDHCPRAL